MVRPSPRQGIFLPWQALAGPGRPWQAMAGLGPYVRVGSAPAAPCRPSSGLNVDIRALLVQSLTDSLVVHGFVCVRQMSLLVVASFRCILGFHRFRVFAQSPAVDHKSYIMNYNIRTFPTLSLHSTAIYGTHSSPRVPDTFLGTTRARAFAITPGMFRTHGSSGTAIGFPDHELPSAPTGVLCATQQLHFTLPGVRRQLTLLPDAG